MLAGRGWNREAEQLKELATPFDANKAILFEILNTTRSTRPGPDISL
jgi:hypothetical protein